MKEFEINGQGVCLNPNKIEYAEDTGVFIRVETAMIDGKWRFGFHIAASSCGASWPCSRKSEPFTEERYAILAAVEEMLSFVRWKENESEDFSWHKKTLELIRFESRQMSLF